MTLLPLFLGGALKRLLSAGKWLMAHPLHAACLVPLLACVWLWRGKEKAVDQRDAWHNAWTLQKRASDLAEAAQLALNREHERKAREAAEHAQKRYHEALDRVRLAGADYKLTHRVRIATGPAGQGIATAESVDSAVPADPAAGPVMVAISDPDFDACGQAAHYAYQAHLLALDLIAKGVAEPAK